MVFVALLNASTCFGVYPVVSRAANQTTVVAVPVLCTAGAVVAPTAGAAGAAGAAVAAAPPAAGVGAAAPPPLHAASTPAPADNASPRKRSRRLSRACHRRMSLTVFTSSVRPSGPSPAATST